MEIFALDFLKGKGEVNPSYLGSEWYYYKNGRYKSGGSRGSFGITSAAYKCLRGLTKKGLVKEINKGTASGFSYTVYTEK